VTTASIGGRRSLQGEKPGDRRVLVERPHADKPAPITIVVLPELVARHWSDRLLYNQSSKRLKAALAGREHTVIADVPYRRGH
jgi:hypothetical protein